MSGPRRLKREFHLDRYGHRLDESLDEELRFHLEERLKQLMQTGLTREEAQAEVRRLFGDVEEIRKECQELNRGISRRQRRIFLKDLSLDIRFSLRTLRRQPVFTIVAILSLALGIGANTAIFSIYSSVFLEKLPVREPDQLVELYSNEPDTEDFMKHSVSSYPDFMDIREQGAEVFEDVMIYNVTVAIFDNEQDSEYLFGEMVSANYFELLGVDPILGRGFIEEEEGFVGAPPTVVLGYDFWQNRFGGDPDVIGTAIPLNGHNFTIVGVAPKNFRGLFPLTADVWYPITLIPTLHPGDNQLSSRSSQTFFLKARLREGITIDEARSALDVISVRLAQEYPETSGSRRFLALPSKDVSLHPDLDTILHGFTLFLMGMVGLVLLIACTNLANLLMARATTRRREIGVRLAIGASRFRLLRQLLTESTLLALLGGLVGLAFGWWLIHLLVTFQPPIPIPINLDLGINGNVLAFTFCLSIVTGIIFGLLPATQTTRPDLVNALKGADDAAGGHLRRLNLRNTLIISQVAISALLLIFSGLFLRSLGNANTVDPGFDIEHGVIATIEISESGYSTEEGQVFFTNLLDRLAVLPGVVSIGMTDRMPLGYSISMQSFYSVSGTSELDAEGEDLDYSAVNTGYFRTMGIPILLGRDFNEFDITGAERVMIINETMARRYWPDGNMIGSQVALDETGEDLITVVGIAKDGKYLTLGEAPRPFAYFASAQQSNMFTHVIARTNSSASSLVPMVRDHIRQIDSHLPILDIVTVPEHLQLMLFLPRALASLLAGLGFLSLILGTIGLYGVIAYDVSRRTREVGIRISLGARKSQVLRQIVGNGLKLVAIGTMIGLALAFITTRFLASMLFGISPTDPITFLGISLLFVGIAIAASWRPAWRAADINPIEALRQE